MTDKLSANSDAQYPVRKPRRRATAGSAPSPSGPSIADLVRELWQAAVKLRRSIEPADYKRFVLPIIFLRFLSLRFDRRHTELEKLIRDPTSDHFGDKKALRDPDEYRSAGAFILPEEARWSAIVELAAGDDVKVKLDDVLERLERKYPDQLRGLLPRIYAGSNMQAEDLRGLIRLFSKDVFRVDHGSEDLIGRVYEYFIGEFAASEGKRGGEYFTPASIVRTLVAMLEPDRGVVFDPCCGSGGMFVQSDLFTKHNHQLSFVGQESKEFTYRLCRMNLFIHGIEGDIRLGDSYTNDALPDLRADFILANPPFNDGSKGDDGWGADAIPKNDRRLVVGGARMPLAPRNANTMWMLHFLHHLKDGGAAGFVMATGELSNAENARLEVRKSLVEAGVVDCIVQMSGQLFANTQIPCALWFLSKSRDGKSGFRSRQGEILFIDARKLGALIPGSRKQKQLSDEEVARIASTYREFRRTGTPAPVPGFCRAAPLEEVREHRYALTPGRYVGSPETDDDEEPIEEKLPKLKKLLEQQFDEAALLEKQIRANLARLGDDAAG